MEREELEGWLRLTLTPGVGDITARKLLGAFGLPGDVFRQTPAALVQVVSETCVAALQQAPAGLEALVETTWQWLHGSDATGAARRVLTLGDAGYPAGLLQMADPPLMLYTLGAAGFNLAQVDRSLAMVGSRNPTPQGLSNARAFAQALGEAHIVVVSGLALGIDGAAHQGALDAAGSAQRLATVAFVGTGLDRVYPARHRDLARRIVGQGMLVSEFPLGTPPLTQNFPKRNRLIAGLSQGTLVVEAALQSGSLITARSAVEQGKEVFAIPGSIHAPQSRGCHALIRQGAKLVESVHDILEELHFPMSTHATSAGSSSAKGPDNMESENPLLEALGHDPVTLDALTARTGWSASDLQVRLLELELDGHVARLPGGLFQRVASA
ncbi:DNA-processing protein DprA [Variovorax rhizosphaerae]|uniref:DNA-processing protein DprA n=1 Tax=Variovorax rhizosphaerae TaxID=1836200 RepID=A0ABU8WEP5_9BURK